MTSNLERRADAFRDRGRRFAETRMAESYRFRPPHPTAAYRTLQEPLDGHPGIILDAGWPVGRKIYPPLLYRNRDHFAGV